MISLHHSGPITMISSCQADAISKWGIELLKIILLFIFFRVFQKAGGYAYDSPDHLTHFIIIRMLSRY